jgi:hypothetical protein
MPEPARHDLMDDTDCMTMIEDLRALMRVVGMVDPGRLDTPHLIMRACIREVEFMREKLGRQHELIKGDYRFGIMSDQDDCLIAMEDGKPLPTYSLRALPAWRAVMLARAGVRHSVLERGTLAQIVAEAEDVAGGSRLPPRRGGGEKLGEWWKRHGIDSVPRYGREHWHPRSYE